MTIKNIFYDPKPKTGVQILSKRKGTFMNKLSLKAKLMLTMMGLATFVSIGSQSIGYYQSRSALTESASNTIRGISGSKRDHLIDQIQLFEEQLRQISTTPRTQYLLQELSSAFTDLNPSSMANYNETEAKASIKAFYESQFIPTFNGKNTAAPMSSSEFISKLSPEGIYLQYKYVSSNPHGLGEKNNLFDANDGTMWSAFHKETHSDQKPIVDALGLYDVFFVNPEGYVVYSDFKELDFATSLVNGPFAQSGIGEAFRLAKDSTDPQKVFMTDMKPYFPSYMDSAVFMSMPVINESQKNLGVIIIQLPLAVFNDILSSNKRWESLGLSASGDIFLVNKDLQVMTALRGIQEDKDAFIKGLEQTDKDKKSIQLMNLKGTTSLLFDYSDVKEWQTVVSGDSGMAVMPNLHGEEYFLYYTPMEIPGVDWYLVTRENVSDALAAVYSMQTFMTYFALIVQVIVIFVSFFFASYLVSEIVSQIQKLNSAATDTEDAGSRIKEASERVSSSTTEQASAIQETVATLNEITAMVNKSVDGVERSREKAEASHKVAEDGQAAVNEMVKAMESINDANTKIMEQINESNKQITEIVDVISEISEKTKVINDIVFQTKLLSFNASVEAARAGEHGKGFAVVAEEVGNLAQMSGNAAKEIGDMLSNSIAKVEGIVDNTKSSVTKLVEDGKAKVESGVVIANRCGEVLSQVVSNISDVRSNMDEITSASREQAEGVNNITTAMNELDQTTHLNSEIAGTTLTCSNDLNEASTETREAINSLKSLVFGPNAKAMDMKLMEASGKSSKNTTPTNVVSLQSMKKKPATQPEISFKQAAPKKVVGSDYVPANDPRFEDV
jgi:methyl-accepting chemotaxis protein